MKVRALEWLASFVVLLGVLCVSFGVTYAERPLVVAGSVVLATGVRVAIDVARMRP